MDATNGVLYQNAIAASRQASLTSYVLRSQSGKVLKASNVEMSLDFASYVPPWMVFLRHPGTYIVDFSLSTGANNAIYLSDEEYWQKIGDAQIMVSKKEGSWDIESTPSVIGFAPQVSGYMFQLKVSIESKISYNLSPKPINLYSDTMVDASLFNWFLLGPNKVSYI